MPYTSSAIPAGKQEPERDSIYGARERYALRVPRPIVVYEIGAILFDAIRNTT